MKRGNVLLFLAFASSAFSDTVTIGTGTERGAKVAPCHLVSFESLTDAVARVRKEKADRAESVSDAEIAAVRKDPNVRVRITRNDDAPVGCLRSPGVPRRVVFKTKGAGEPLLTVTIVAERIQGSAQYRGFGSMTPHEVSETAKDMEAHLIYDGRATFIMEWNKGYAAKILGNE